MLRCYNRFGISQVKICFSFTRILFFFFLEFLVCWFLWNFQTYRLKNGFENNEKLKKLTATPYIKSVSNELEGNRAQVVYKLICTRHNCLFISDRMSELISKTYISIFFFSEHRVILCVCLFSFRYFRGWSFEFCLNF